MRVLLTNYLSKGAEPADINEIFGRPLASSRHAFDDAVGVSAAELTEDEVERLRPAVYRRAAQREGMTFYKVHDRWSLTSAGEPLTPPEVSLGVIYLLRNPLDVAVSFSHHTGWSIESIVDSMADPTFCLSAGSRRLDLQLPQKLSTWSTHVTGWVDQCHIPVHVVRFEDLKGDPERAFEGVVRFLGGGDEEAIRRAVYFSRFSELQRQEAERGFKETPVATKAFFRRGVTGAWRDEVPPHLVERVVEAHAAVMKRFGYLDAHDRPTAGPDDE